MKISELPHTFLCPVVIRKSPVVVLEKCEERLCVHAVSCSKAETGTLASYIM